MIGRALLTFGSLDTRFAEVITATFKLLWAFTLWYGLTHYDAPSSPVNRMIEQSPIPPLVFIGLLALFALAHLWSALSNRLRYTTTAIAAMFWGAFALMNISGDGWPSTFLFFVILALINAWAHLRLYLLRDT